MALGDKTLQKPNKKQLLFAELYNSPASETYGNAYRSAVKAGYTHSYAMSSAYKTLVPLADMLSQKTENNRLERIEKSGEKYARILEKAENVIENDINLEDKGDEKRAMRRQKAATFAAERLGKDRWATKTITENTGLVNLESVAVGGLLGTLVNALESSHKDQSTPRYDYTIEKQGEEPRTKDDN